MSTKELQKELCTSMKNWQKIEDASVVSTGKIMEKTENPLIRQVMEIIQLDSQLHRRVQELIIATLERTPVSLAPEELATVWDGIEKHVAIEHKMVRHVEDALKALKGKKMLVQEYLLNYLLTDERKHDSMLEALNKIKAGMYPYAS